MAIETDNNIWLENIEGEDALNWSRERNKIVLDQLSLDPRFNKIKEKAYSYYTDQEKIPYGSIYKDSVRNFWQDKKNIRGLWRKTSLKDYQIGKDNWETIIDLDLLAEKEGKNWVFNGPNCLYENPDICLVSLSDGGKDASFIREFHINKNEFIKDGFSFPESKSRVSWFDENTILVSDATEKDHLTDSGYPRILKIQKRGEDLKNVPAIFEGAKEDVSVGAWVSHHNKEKIIFISRSITFYDSEYFILGPDLKTITKLKVPKKSEILGLFNGYVLLSIKEDWELGGKNYLNGSVLAVSSEDLKKQKEAPNTNVLFSPSKKTAFYSLDISRENIYLIFIEDVKRRIIKISLKEKWESSSFNIPDENGAFYIYSTHPERDNFFFGSESSVLPPSIYYYNSEKDEPILVRSRKPWFKGDDLEINQHFSLSKDGTKVPYFLIHKKGLKKNSNNPTILYGYGGFEVSLFPDYNAVSGMFWLEKGGVYVLSNIRGGGEYGPQWHQAAILENRQKAFDDFHSIAEDLIKRKITKPSKLAIKGGSNGGLLTSVAFTQRPDLYGAVISQVPITDMLRYHKLLAGASWMGEYGDPDIKKDQEFLLKYSPYHNINEGVKFPKLFYLSSTKDDRVHPGHARKMVSRLLDKGHEVLYYENIEGGHGFAANLKQYALMAALEYVFLYHSLNVSN